MTEKKFGTKDLKEILDFALELGMGVDRSMADGKFEMTDVSNFMPALMLIGPAFSDVKNIADEVKDLDAAEMEDLNQHIKDKFDIADDEIEEYIEMGLDVAVSIYNLVMKIVARKPKAD